MAFEISRETGFDMRPSSTFWVSVVRRWRMEIGGLFVCRWLVTHQRCAQAAFHMEPAPMYRGL